MYNQNKTFDTNYHNGYYLLKYKNLKYKTFFLERNQYTNKKDKSWNQNPDDNIGTKTYK